MNDLPARPASLAMAAAAPPDLQEDDRQRLRRQLAASRATSETAMALAEAAGARALRQAATDAEESPADGRKPAARASDPSLAFVRLSAELRQLIMLEIKVAAGAFAPGAGQAGRRQATPAEKRHARLRGMLIDAVDADLRGRSYDTLMGKVDDRLALTWVKEAIERGEPVGALASRIADELDVLFETRDFPDHDLWRDGLPPEDPDDPDPPSRDYELDPPWSPGWGLHPGPEELRRRVASGRTKSEGADPGPD